MSLTAMFGRLFGFHTVSQGFATQHPISVLVKLDSAWRQHNDLAQLSADARRDLGLTEGDIASELRRPFWNAPSHWTGR